MMRIVLFLCLSVLLFANDKVLLHLDFKGIKDTSNATNVLVNKGFEFKLDKQKFNFYIKDEKLYIVTDREAAVLFGMVLHGKKALKDPTYAVIEWGVDSFPRGAQWENGNNRLPIGLIMVFGSEKLFSGVPSFIAPRVPTFLSPFIGETEKVGKTYLGKLYKKGGRYYCVSNQGSGVVVTTKFDIKKHYFKEFKKITPAMTAFAFQVNTLGTEGGSKAFIKSLTIYTKEK